MILVEQSLEHLSNAFQLDKHISFSEKSEGFIIATLTSPMATASVAVHGGHVLSFRPEAQEPVLWLSEHSHYTEGKAIRGGVPVIWPWFGPHSTDGSKPSHGFARNRFWKVYATRLIDDESPQIRLKLADDALTRSQWPHPFLLEIVVTLTSSLHIDLVIENTGDASFQCTNALHSYFNVSHIEAIHIEGIEGKTYIDQLSPGDLRVQEGPLRFNGETDNIYLDTSDTCRLIDPGFERTIIVEKSGSQSTVIWNPWVDKSARMSDFGNEEYIRMVCIEAANAATDIVHIAPHYRHTLSTKIAIEKI